MNSWPQLILLYDYLDCALSEIIPTPKVTGSSEGKGVSKSQMLKTKHACKSKLKFPEG